MSYKIAILTALLIGIFNFAGIPPLGLVVVLFLLGLGFILGLKEYLETDLSNK